MILFFATFSCFFSFFLKAFLFLFFLERKGSKRKSSAEQLLFAAVVFFANMLHKTDGSHTNRPFFSFHAGHAGKRLFSDKSTVPQCLLFLFFKKRNRPLLFFLEEKTVSLRGKRRFSDGRTQAYPALSSVGIPPRVCLPPPPCLCPCPPRLRASFPVQTDHAKENRLRLSFFSALLLLSPTCSTKRTVRM